MLNILKLGKGVDNAIPVWYTYTRMKTFTTKEAAKKLGIGLMTLNRYIAAQKVLAPRVRLVGSLAKRVWTNKDIERARKKLPKIANGRRKKKRK